MVKYIIIVISIQYLIWSLFKLSDIFIQKSSQIKTLDLNYALHK